MQIRFLVLYESQGADRLLGFPLHLTPTERKLLVAIAKNGTADIDHLCSLLPMGVSRGNVAVHINSINRKAEQISSRKLIVFSNNAYAISEKM